MYFAQETLSIQHSVLMFNFAVGVKDDVVCAFTEWSEWSSCTKTCSSGNQARRRTFILTEGVDSVFCDGNLTEVAECNADIPCPGINDVHCIYNSRIQQA